ncbi:MAG: hypothetical protein OXF86_12005 [Caldilineaceae bacterium]|nr:hypothetical protein [Caldilineaceae bacterium]
MSAHDQFTIQLGGGLTWLAKRHDLSCTEVQVVNTLILLDGPDGCHPSFATIAEVSGRPYLMVRKSIKSLKEKRLIDTENRPYRDARGRELKSKSYTYVFSEEIEQALEFAAETIELRRRKTQMPLLSADPDRAPGDLYLDPNRAPEDPYLDPDRAPGDPYLDQPGQPADPDRAPEDLYLDPDRAPGDPYLDQIARQGITNRGRLVGRKDLYLQKIKDPTYLPTYATPDEDDQRLSLTMMSHPDISLPEDFKEAVARKFRPQVVFHVCACYCFDLARGAVQNTGVLMYRLANLDQSPPRRLSDAQGETIEFYQQFHVYAEQIMRDIEQKEYEQESAEDTS